MHPLPGCSEQAEHDACWRAIRRPHISSRLVSPHALSPVTAAHLQELDLAAYLVHCERRLAEEYDRCEAYLGLSLRRPLKSILDQCLLEAHMSSILDGTRQLLASCQEQDLGRLYR